MKQNRILNLTAAGRLLWLFLSATLMAACSTTRQVVPARPSAASELKPGGTLILLQPKLVYESASSEARLDGTQFGSPQVSDDLVRAAEAGFREKGFTVVDAGKYRPELADSIQFASKLTAASDQLLRASVPADLAGELRSLAGQDPNASVLVQYFKIKLGPGSSWDPNTGAITSAMHSSHLRAAVIDCQTGRSLWQNEFYLREVPRVTSRNYRKAVDSLYQNPIPER